MFELRTLKKILCALVLVILLSSGYAQNLVENGSFESISSCPEGLTSSGYSFYVTGIDTTHDFLRLADPWYCPTSGTSDLISLCATSSLVTVPDNIWGTALAQEGDNYIATILYHNHFDNWQEQELEVDYTEYAQAPLSEALLPGATYHFSMHYRWAENSKFAIDQLGMALTIGELTEGEEIDSSPLEIQPIITTLAGQVNDVPEWRELSGEFVADQPYDHITIGRFASTDDLEIQLMTTEVVSLNLRRAIYFMDNIILTFQDVVQSIGDHERDSWRVLPDGVDIQESGTLEIYDVLGRALFQREVLPGDFVLWPMNLQKGSVYVLRLGNSSERIVRL